jgi:glucose-6-phosphate isomerase
MRRTQVQFDEESYRALKDEAHARGVSMSEVLRRLVRDHLGQEQRGTWRIEDFTFIGMGDSGIGPGHPLYPLSEKHDEALTEDSSW